MVRRSAESFGGVEEEINATTTQSYPDSGAEFILDSDVSDYGIGAVLPKNINEEERVIEYGNKVLTKQERQNGVIQRELLAVILFVTP